MLIIPGHGLVQDAMDRVTVRVAVSPALCDGKWLLMSAVSAQGWEKYGIFCI